MRRNFQLEMPKRNSFDKDFVLRSALIITDLDCAYKVENFTVHNMHIIERKWDEIQSAVVRSVKLTNKFGLDRDTLTSVNSLMPLIYFFSGTNSDLLGSTEFDVKNSERVRIWLAAALLGNAFGGSVNATLALARKLVRDGLEQSPNFPSKRLAEGLRLRGRIIDFDDAMLDNVLDISYSEKRCYFVLSLLYKQTALTSSDLHIDHIFPRSLFENRKLKERGLSEAFGERCRLLLDKIGNLQLLPAHENIEKSDFEFNQWIDTRSSMFVTEHMIPEDSELWTVERFPEFINERSKLIRSHLARLMKQPSD